MLRHSSRLLLACCESSVGSVAAMPNAAAAAGILHPFELIPPSHLSLSIPLVTPNTIATIVAPFCLAERGSGGGDPRRCAPPMPAAAPIHRPPPTKTAMYLLMAQSSATVGLSCVARRYAAAPFQSASNACARASARAMHTCLVVVAAPVRSFCEAYFGTRVQQVSAGS